MHTRILNVSNAAELESALAAATGGGTIQLEAGNYGKLQLIDGRTKFNVTHSAEAPVTIRSADADNPAVFTGLDLRDTSGFTFENLLFDYTYEPAQNLWNNAFSVSDSNNITIRGCTFDGDVAVNRNAEDDDRGFGIGFKAGGCTNLVFANNTIHTFHRGATFGNGNNVVVSGNDIHSIRMDGLNFVGMQGLAIENNHLHDFKRSLEASDHADMIQFWTNKSTRPSTDIVIRGNTLDIGGGDNTQSIFMRNEEVDNGRAGTEMFYRNVLIEENTIYNDHMHGITVGEATGLIIRNNSVLHANGATEGPTGSVSVPKINVAGASTDVTIVNNLAGGVSGHGSVSLPASWTVGNNLIVQDSIQSEPNHYTDLFLSTSLNDPGPANAFLALPGGLIDTMGVGPAGLRIEATPAQITPLFHVSTLPADDGVFVFDAASHTNGPLGAITPDVGTFLWDFGDGNIGTGGVVSHRYAAPGNYTVTVSVVRPDGSAVSTSGTAVAAHPDLLRLDTATGSFGIAGDAGETLTALSPTALAGSAGAWALDLGQPGVTASVSKTQIADLFGADNFALDLTLKADLGPLSHGEVFRVHNTFIASVNSAGQFVFQIWGGEKSVTLTSTGPNLLDGAAHDISLRFDADLGSLTVSVDGTAAGSLPFTADLPVAGSSDLVFGNPWGKRNFDGQIQKFDLNVDRSDYPVYTGTATPVTSLVTNIADSQETGLPPLADTPHMPDVLTLDDYVLDSAAIVALKGDMHRIQEDGQTVLVFDGTGDQVVLGHMFDTSDRLAVAVEFRRDVVDGSSGRLVTNSDKIQLMVVGDSFLLNVATADAGMKWFQIGNLGLNDTDWHEAMVIVDTVADRLQVFVDDRLRLDDQSHDFVPNRPDAVGSQWFAGTDFNGRIAEIRIDDDIEASALPQAIGDDLTAFF